jgi:hypothetical protein
MAFQHPSVLVSKKMRYVIAGDHVIFLRTVKPWCVVLVVDKMQHVVVHLHSKPLIKRFVVKVQ